MQVKLLASAALFSILSLAQIKNVDQNLVSRLSADAAAIQANPTWTSALNAIASAAPASVLAAAGNNPSVLFNQIATATTIPSWYTNIPTSVVGSLATIVAPAIKANADFNAYINSVAAQPAGSSLLNAVYSAAPASVQSAYSTNKLGLAAAVVASTPAWLSNIPLPVQTSIAAVYNSALRIEASDLENGKTASRTATGSSYTRPSSVTGAPPYGTGKPSSLPPPFATGRPSTCPACPACTPVTVYTTVTAAPSASSASIRSASSVSAASKPSSSGASTGFPKPTATASTGFPKPNTYTAPPPAVLVSGTTGLPSVVKTAPSASVVVFSSKTASGSVVAFTGGAVAGMRKGGVGLAAVVVVAGVGGLLVV